MPSRHRRQPDRRDYTAFARVQALLVILVIQAGFATVHAHNRRMETTTVATGFAAPLGTVAVPPTPSPTQATPRPSATPKPRVAKVPARTEPTAATRAARTKKWIPTGTGMWTYLWNRTEGGDTMAVVRKAQRQGLTHIFVRTGTRKGGFDGQRVLSQLLPATKGTGLDVIAWDFPLLVNPEADARRLAAAAHFSVPGAPRVRAVAPDIETGAEGTRLSGPAVDRYLRTLRKLLPPDVPILTCIPWPSEKRLGKFPYDIVGNLSDGLIPMAYWINRDPGTVAAQTMLRLKKYGKPVMPVGQAYDPRIDVPNLPWGPPSHSDVAEFMKVSKKYGAPSVSLWVWQFAKPSQWTALNQYRGLFS